jgi:hypothetical protein
MVRRGVRHLSLFVKWLVRSHEQRIRGFACPNVELIRSKDGAAPAPQECVPDERVGSVDWLGPVIEVCGRQIGLCSMPVASNAELLVRNH